jgi:hypothetical protein
LRVKKHCTAALFNDYRKHIPAPLFSVGYKTNSLITAHALFSALNGIMISYARYPGKTDEEIRRHTLRLAESIAGVFSGKNL